MSARAVETVPPPGFWRRADTHYPRPLSPFGRSLLLPAANEGFRAMCAEFGLLVETVEEREIGGWVYLRVVPLGGRDWRPPPLWALRWLVRLSPRLRKRLRTCAQAVRDDRAGEAIERWRTEWRPDLEQRLAGLRETDLKSLPDEDLAVHLAAIFGLVADSQRIHMVVNHSINVLLAEFVFVTAELLGWSDDAAIRLLTGSSETSTAPARAVARLGDRAMEIPAVRALLEHGAPADTVLAADPGFAADFYRFQRWYGARTIGYDVADPTLAERPELVLAQVRDHVRKAASGNGPTSSAAVDPTQNESARRALEGRPADRARFERALQRAHLAYPIREEHGFFDTMMPLALARGAVLEAGRRFTERRRLAAPADVFLLEHDEVGAALRSRESLHEAVDARRRERAAAHTHPGPGSYGTPMPPPALTGLPAEVVAVHRAVQWSYERVFAPGAMARDGDPDGVLPGVGASPGRYTGTARVMHGEADLSRLEPGDVLVAQSASPVWSIVFPRIGALVTDTGGALCHCAIIAREFGIPAVVATRGATRHLQDGDLVTVDGKAGTVTIRRANERGTTCRGSSSSTP
jgi:rifampicin phosphotransferase